MKQNDTIINAAMLKVVYLSGKIRQVSGKVSPSSILKLKQKILKLNALLNLYYLHNLRMYHFSDISQTISLGKGGLQSREPQEMAN